MKRVTGKSLGIIILCFCALCGCAKEEELEIKAESAKESIVVWSYYETDEQQKSLDKLVEDFNYSQKMYEARWEYVPMTEFTKRLAIGVTEEALPDVVIIDNPDMSTYVNLGLFEDITQETESWEHIEGYYSQVWESVIYEGRCYGIPFCCNNLALIYNKTLLKEAGIQPPVSWEEFLNAAEILTREGTKGFVMSAVEGEQAAFQLLPWILSEGEAPETIGGEKTAAALDKIYSMVESGLLDRNCINWSQNDIARQFAAGEAAMMENGSWILPMLDESGIDYGIVELPFAGESRSIIGGENLGVIKDKNVQGALAFLKYYSQNQVMQDICTMSNVLPPKKELGLQAAENNESLKIFVQQMEQAVSRASFTGWAKTSKALSEAVYNVIIQDMTPQQAAEDIRMKLDEN